MSNTNAEETIRLNVAIPQTLHDRISARVPHGLKADLVRRMMEMLAEMLENEGTTCIILMHEGKIGFTMPNGRVYYPSTPK